jgi:hypothetical protein
MNGDEARERVLVRNSDGVFTLGTARPSRSKGSRGHSRLKRSEGSDSKPENGGKVAETQHEPSSSGVELDRVVAF